MKLVLHKNFAKQYKKLPIKVQTQTKNRLKLFLTNPNDKRLRNHALLSKYQGYRSINITGDYRAVFKVVGSKAVFTHIGTHSQLYKKIITK